MHLRAHLLPLFSCFHPSCFVDSPSLLWLFMLLHDVCFIHSGFTILILADWRVYVFDQVVDNVLIATFLVGKVAINGSITPIGVISWQAWAEAALRIYRWFAVVCDGTIPRWFWSWHDLPHDKWVSVGHLPLLQRRVVELYEVSARNDITSNKLCLVIAENFCTLWSLIHYLIVEEG